jgi:hypothetical protein
MKNYKMLLLVPAAVLAAACGREESTADDALKNDLALASQAQAFNPQQVTSAAEMGYAYNPYTGQFQPIPQQTPQVQQVASRPRTTSAPRRTSSSSSGSSRVVYQPAPAPAPTIKRNTKRDAVIGAAAGAVIGATTSRDRVKGAVIGAVAGGVLGGIIGHTVDVQRTP